MIQISSFQFENEYGQTLQVNVDLTGETVSLTSKEGFTIDKIEDLEQIVARIAKTLKDIQETSRKK